MTVYTAKDVPSYVPNQYQAQIADLANLLAIPPEIIAAQINLESSFNPKAQSGAGAEGIAQFLPSTFAEFGPKGGSPFNVGDAFMAYYNYMKELLKEENGDVRKALEAYNAGPGNLSAGSGYADTIITKAGVGDVTAGTPGTTDTSGLGSTGNPTDTSSSSSSSSSTSIFSLPSEILNWFSQRMKTANKVFDFLGNWFPNPLDPKSVAKVKTDYVRLGAGFVGGIFLIMGIIGLAMAARQKG